MVGQAVQRDDWGSFFHLAPSLESGGLAFRCIMHQYLYSIRGVALARMNTIFGKVCFWLLRCYSHVTISQSTN